MESLLEIIGSKRLPDDFSEYIDVESGLKRVAGSQAVFLRLLKSFFDNGQLEQLAAQAESGDAQGAALTAHGIKGVAGNLSLTKMHGVISRFEGQLKQGVIDKTLKDEVFAVGARTAECTRTLVEYAG